MRLLMVMAASAVFATACAGANGPGVTQQPQPLPERGEARSEPIDEDHVRVWPASGSVQEGVPYQMTAYTHCGLDHSLDFDGSFWEVEKGPEDPWDVLDNPEDVGVITLESQDVAVYESSAGGEFRMRRVEGQGRSSCASDANPGPNAAGERQPSRPPNGPRTATAAPQRPWR